MASPQLQQWFQLADTDRDGRIGGKEAVQFFTKSGLPQDTLGHIWELASGGGPFLNINQFTTALRLVALAQANMGRLPPDVARAVALGGGPQLPLPRLAGLPAAPPPQQQPSYTPQSTGGAPQPPPYTPQSTGGGQYGAPPPPPQASSPYPPASAVDMQRYSTMFVTLDRDRDGLVQGADCFGAFMQSGLDKGALKAIWDAVAGNAGALNQGQFVAAVYLIDCAKRGVPVPRALPPGQFPPLAPPPVVGGRPGAPGGALPAQAWTLESQFGAKTASRAVADAYNQVLPPVPGLPSRAQWDPSAAVPPSMMGGPSQVPGLDGSVAGMLGRDERDMYESAQRDAAAKEAALAAAKADAEAARQRERLFNDALAEIKLFKSRTDVAAMQAAEASGRLKADADAAEKSYKAAFDAAQSQYAEHLAMREQINALVTRKEEAGKKLEALHAELAAASTTSPVELRMLQGEVEALNSALSAAEARKAQLELQLDGGRKQRELLGSRVAEYRAAAVVAEAEVKTLSADLAELNAAAEAARTLGGDAVLSELARAAAAYRALHAAAAARNLEVPYEAGVSNVGGLVWVDSLLTGASDWVDGDGPGEGFVLVNALPDLDALLAGLKLSAVPPAMATPPGAAVDAALSTPDAAAVAAAALPPPPEEKKEAEKKEGASDGGGAAADGAAADGAAGAADKSGGGGAAAAAVAAAAAAATGAVAAVAAASAATGADAADASVPAPAPAAAEAPAAAAAAAADAPAAPAAVAAAAVEEEAAPSAPPPPPAAHHTMAPLASDASTIFGDEDGGVQRAPSLQAPDAIAEEEGFEDNAFAPAQ